ncbi:MFS transporter [Promicromonospora citrea]|uniref:MFS transporter n=1 Tax=Promicromonospora citrea TaxID=43677 RepID=UPI00148903F7|nr:MFS transporter [Promicromonospora citrea]NNH51008.1 MFS transporter [Promicromonospora citrea]
MASTSKTFGMLWGAQLVLLLLSTGSALALSLSVFDRTEAVTALAAVTAASLASSIYLAPAIGTVIDRVPRKVAIVGANVGVGVTSLAVAAVVWRDLPTWLLITLVLCAGIFSTAIGLSLQASVRLLRREADLTRANAVVSVIENAPVFAGPLVGALVYALAAPHWVFVIEGAGALAVALLVSRIAWDVPDPVAMRRSPNPFHGLRRGFRFILGDRDLRAVQVSFAGLNVAGGFATPVATAFVIAGAGGAMAAESWRLTTVSIAGSLGLLLGSVVVLALAGRVRRGTMIVGGMVAGGLLGRVGLALTTSLVAIVPAYVARNICVQVSNAPLTAIWQERTPPEIQATVFGARRLLGQGLYPVAVVAGGLLVDALVRMGVPAVGAMTIALAGAGLVEVVCGLGLWATRAPQRLETAPAVREPADAA